ncbi:MAG: UDP-3-O-acyl-N-acetylglucosamine deacetylase, partial [Alphaproteobacteria bacterium]
VYIHRDSPINPFGFRMPDEPVRHRVIDVLGDLALAGAPIEGRVTVHGPSHKKNRDAVARLMSSPDIWRMQEYQ